jgi:TnpA family transposase
VGTASTEAILRRFTRANNTHPTYQAMLEVGRAQKTAFIARYLRLRELQREINDGPNVMESWNRANEVIHYGRSGEFATNRRDEQELGAIALHILQAALVYVGLPVAHQATAMLSVKGTEGQLVRPPLEQLRERDHSRRFQFAGSRAHL